MEPRAISLTSINTASPAGPPGFMSRNKQTHYIFVLVKTESHDDEIKHVTLLHVTTTQIYFRETTKLRPCYFLVSNSQVFLLHFEYTEEVNNFHSIIF